MAIFFNPNNVWKSEKGNAVTELYYPLEKWEIVPELVANCSEPKVICEAGYTE